MYRNDGVLGAIWPFFVHLFLSRRACLHLVSVPGFSIISILLFDSWHLPKPWCWPQETSHLTPLYPIPTASMQSNPISGACHLPKQRSPTEPEKVLTKLGRSLRETHSSFLGKRFKWKKLRLRSWNKGNRVCLQNGPVGQTIPPRELGWFCETKGPGWGRPMCQTVWSNDQATDGGAGRSRGERRAGEHSRATQWSLVSWAIRKGGFLPHISSAS